MTLTASPENQVFGESAEETMFGRIRHALFERGSRVVVRRGPIDSRENGRFGDCLCSASDWEAPVVTIELKAANYPASFSFSDYEKRVSVTRWVMVSGTQGVWIVSTDIAREHLTQADGGNSYWICNPPFSSRATFKFMLDDIQRTFGEIR